MDLEIGFGKWHWKHWKIELLENGIGNIGNGIGLKKQWIMDMETLENGNGNGYWNWINAIRNIGLQEHQKMETGTNGNWNLNL